MNLRLSRTFLNKSFLLVLIDVGADDGVEVASLPVSLGGLRSQDVLVEAHLLVMVLQVTIRHYIVVSLSFNFDLLAADAFLCCGGGSLAWRLEMMLLHVDVADDVVVRQSVLARTEVPGLLLGVVGAVLQALQLVVEVKDVVGLLIAQRSVLYTAKRQVVKCCQHTG